MVCWAPYHIYFILSFHFPHITRKEWISNVYLAVRPSINILVAKLAQLALFLCLPLCDNNSSCILPKWMVNVGCGEYCSIIPNYFPYYIKQVTCIDLNSNNALLVLLACDGQLLCQPDHLLLDELKVSMMIKIMMMTPNGMVVMIVVIIMTVMINQTFYMKQIFHTKCHSLNSAEITTIQHTSWVRLIRNVDFIERNKDNSSFFFIENISKTAPFKKKLCFLKILNQTCQVLQGYMHGMISLTFCNSVMDMMRNILMQVSSLF